MSFLKMLDANVVQFLEAISKMENPDIEIVKVKNYVYKGKKWEIMILIRDQKEEKK